MSVFWGEKMAQRIMKILYNKTYRRIAAGAIFTGLLVKNSLKHVFPEDLFFPFYAYRTNKPYVIQAMKLLNQCNKDIGIDPNSFKVTPFVSATTEVCSAGFSAFNLNRSHIGIPASFFCHNVEELSHNDIVMKTLSGFRHRPEKQFEVVDPTEVKLMESLLLSEDAQRFAVARHIFYLQGNWALYQAMIPSAFVIIGYALMFNLPRFLFTSKSHRVHLNLVLGVTLLGAVIAYVLCKLTTSAVIRRASVQADLNAANLSSEYTKGGIEMYRKFAETGSALRTLFGKKGERMYTSEGDIVDGLFPSFSTVTPSFSNRVKYLETCWTSQMEADRVS